MACSSIWCTHCNLKLFEMFTLKSRSEKNKVQECQSAFYCVSLSFIVICNNFAHELQNSDACMALWKYKILMCKLGQNRLYLRNQWVNDNFYGWSSTNTWWKSILLLTLTSYFVDYSNTWLASYVIGLSV